MAKVEVAGKSGKIVKEEVTEKSGEKKAFIPFLILVIIFIGIMFSGENTPKKMAKKAQQASSFQDVNNEYVVQLQKRQASENKQIKEKLNVIYQRGLRELREKNYYRAIHEFNLALIVAPGDAQAEYYLRKTKEELDREIEGYTATAQRDEQSLKFRSSIISYCAITRLLSSNPEDRRHKNAVSQIKKLETQLGLEQGETDCLKKQLTSQ